MPSTTDHQSLAKGSWSLGPHLTQWSLVAPGYDLLASLKDTGFEQRIHEHNALVNTEMEVVSMGMIIIDAIYPEGSPTLRDILGGAGTYAVVGARFFCPGILSPEVGYIVHAGEELSQELRDEIASWKSGTHIIETPDRMTTQGKNVYHNGIRNFEFSSPKIQIEPSMLPETYLTAKTYHLICTPARCVGLVKGLLSRREKLITSIPDLSEKFPAEPIFVWEPMEGSCNPGQRKSVYEALKYVDVFSLNQDEAEALFADLPYPNEDDLRRNEPVAVKQGVHKSPFGIYLRLKANGFGDKNCALVLRQGANGCTVCSEFRQIRIPAYHRAIQHIRPEERDQLVDKVVDVTGGGNAFLGGFCAGMRLFSEVSPYIGLNDFEGAAYCGTVAASFAIEQFGMPKLTYKESDGEELWNGECVMDRLSMMLRLYYTKPLVPAIPSENWTKVLEDFREGGPVSSEASKASESTRTEQELRKNEEELLTKVIDRQQLREEAEELLKMLRAVRQTREDNEKFLKSVRDRLL